MLLLLLLLLQADQRVEYEETMSRIQTTTRIADAHDCDLIIEAIIEDKDIKVGFYKVIIHTHTVVSECEGHELLRCCMFGRKAQPKTIREEIKSFINEAFDVPVISCRLIH